MSKKPPASSDPIEFLKARSIEEGACWVWQLAMCNRSSPVARFSSTEPPRTVRRWLWETPNGDVKPGYKIIAKCGEARCVNPGHLKQVTQKGVAQMTVEFERISKVAHKVAAIKAARKNSTLTIERVRGIRAMRAEGKTLREIAGASGISVSHAGVICQGKAWIDAVATSPFAGLGGLR